MAQQWEYITLRISWGKTGDGSKDLEGWTTGDNKYFASLGELCSRGECKVGNLLVWSSRTGTYTSEIGMGRLMCIAPF